MYLGIVRTMAQIYPSALAALSAKASMGKLGLC